MNSNCEQLKAGLADTKSELAETKRTLVEANDSLHRALKEIPYLKEKLKLNSKNNPKPPSTESLKLGEHLHSNTLTYKKP